MPFRESFAAHLGAPLWSLHADEHGQRPALALEVRPPVTGQGAWRVVDLVENQLVELNIAEESESWLTLRGIFNGRVLLHRYPDRQSPQPRGLLAFDARTGQRVWELEDALFQGTDGETFTATRLTPTGPGEVEPFDLATGQQNGWQLAIGDFQLPVPRSHFPHEYSADSAYFPVVARFVRRLTGHEAVETAHYLEVGLPPGYGYLLVSYYIYANELPENWLLVVDGKQKVLLNERLATQGPPRPVPFGVYADRLVVLKNTDHLVVYEL